MILTEITTVQMPKIYKGQSISLIRNHSVAKEKL